MTRDGPGGTDLPLFSRAEVLGGLPARRASGILFAIEAHTARLMAGSRVTRATYVSERRVAEQEQAFLQAMAAGRDLPVTPKVQDLERFAADWAHLVPSAPASRAAVAVLLAAKYRFTADLVPGIREALALHDSEVRVAVRQQTGAPVDALYASSLSLGERFAWRRAALAARMDRLPPFWIAYVLALTETITEGILIVPIAVAGLGPLAGVVTLLVLGAINLVTLGAMVEAITRNGSMRYGAAYFGRLVGELLGRGGSVSLGFTLAIFNAVVLMAYLLGFASVLHGATGVPEEIWVLLLVLVNVWVLRKGNLDETVASAAVIGAVNVTLILIITAIALINVDAEHLWYVNIPFVGDAGFDPLILELVFGVVIVSYFGHTSAANASKMILGRDPSGRSLLWGNLAALATVIALYCLIVVAFVGALGPEPLVGTRGTTFTPLAELVGPVIDVLGSIYVVLAIGLGSLYCSLGLYNQAVEYLPAQARGAHGRLLGWATTPRGRYVVGIAPVLGVFGLLEYLLITDQDWFARPIGLVGVLTVPLIGGVFPMLLVIAARRRGEYVPGRVIGFVGHPLVAGAISAIFLGGVVLHGLVIWQDPIERGLALGVAAITVGLIAWMLRGPAFRRTAVMEIRASTDEAPMRLAYSLTVDGRSAAAEVRLAHPAGAEDVRESPGTIGLDSLSRATFAFVPEGARRLKMWVHQVSADGASVGMGGTVHLADASGERILILDAGGTVAADLGGPGEVVVRWQGADAGGAPA